MRIICNDEMLAVTEEMVRGHLVTVGNVPGLIQVGCGAVVVLPTFGLHAVVRRYLRQMEGTGQRHGELWPTHVEVESWGLLSPGRGQFGSSKMVEGEGRMELGGSWCCGEGRLLSVVDLRFAYTAGQDDSYVKLQKLGLHHDAPSVERSWCVTARKARIYRTLWWPPSRVIDPNIVPAGMVLDRIACTAIVGLCQNNPAGVKTLKGEFTRMRAGLGDEIVVRLYEQPHKLVADVEVIVRRDEEEVVLFVGHVRRAPV